MGSSAAHENGEAKAGVRLTGRGVHERIRWKERGGEQAEDNIKLESRAVANQL